MIKSSNIFEAIPKTLDTEAVSTLIQKGDLKVERIVSKGHTSPESGWYNQAQDEWVIVLKGAATISFEHKEEVNLQAGDYINIPCHTKHKVSWTQPENETIWLAIHY